MIGEEETMSVHEFISTVRELEKTHDADEMLSISMQELSIVADSISFGEDISPTDQIKSDQVAFEHYIQTCLSVDYLRKYPDDYPIKGKAGCYSTQAVYAGWSAYRCGIRDERYKHKYALGQAKLMLRKAIMILEANGLEKDAKEIIDYFYS